MLSPEISASATQFPAHTTSEAVMVDVQPCAVPLLLRHWPLVHVRAPAPVPPWASASVPDAMLEALSVPPLPMADEWAWSPM